MQVGYERVHSVTYYHDGPIAGVADCRGVPHLFASTWDDKEEVYSAVFRLTPLSLDAFDLMMEDWLVWRRWEDAFHAGRTEAVTHPALQPDRARHEELQRQIAAYLRAPAGPEVLMRGEFVPDAEATPLGVSLRALVVRWTPA